MKINLAKSAGFCFGVKRAINIALQAASSYRNIYMLGDIVHNEDVVKQMTEAGIKKIKRLGSGKGKTLLIRAHGAAKDMLRKTKVAGYEIIDATCPMVKEIHKIASEMEKRYGKIIIVGDKNHDEVQGIMGQLKGKAIVIDNAKNIPFKIIKKIKSGCVITQSTQNIEEVLKIVKILNNYIPRVKFFNTICGPTRLKQKEIRIMPKENDVMIIIGSRHSANTKRLYEISKSLNERSYWVNSKDAIKLQWLDGANKVGVAAGASTPEPTINEIIKYLSSLKKL